MKYLFYSVVGCLGSLFAQVPTAAQDLFFVQGSGRVFVQSNAQATVEGGVNLQNGSVLSNQGTITIKEIGAAGVTNWIDGTVIPYFHGDGTVVFNGLGGHTATSPNIFGKIDINAAGHVNLGSQINTNLLYLVNGRVNTTVSYRMAVLTTSELAVQPAPSNANYTNSWINGTLRRFLAPASVNQYQFPVGDIAKPNLAVLTNLTAQPLNNLSYVDARFGSKPGTDVNLSAYEISQYYVSVNNGGVWHLAPDVNPTAGRYDLLLYFNGFTGLENNQFGSLRRPVASSDAAQWQVPTGSVLPPNNTAGRLVINGYVRRNNIGIFGQYGIGLLSTPLPDVSIDLTANRLNKNEVKLVWETRQESTVSGFELERRYDREAHFSVTGFVPSRMLNGTVSGLQTYMFTDANPYQGVSYYRVKALSRSGQAVFTQIKAVKGWGDAAVTVTVFPNPNIGQFSIRLQADNQTYDAFLSDLNGKLVRRFRLNGTTTHTVTDLSAGTYLLKVADVFGPGQSFVEKIIVTR